MFENLKTNNIGNKLLKLMDYELILNDYNKDIKDFIPNCEYKKLENKPILNKTYKHFRFNINNITYDFKKDNYENKIYIFVNNICIASGGDSCLDCDFYLNWQHKMPKEMIKQIRKDSITINNYIKNIKKYIKNHKTIKEIEYDKEHEELNRIFSK